VPCSLVAVPAPVRSGSSGKVQLWSRRVPSVSIQIQRVMFQNRRYRHFSTRSRRSQGGSSTSHWSSGINRPRNACNRSNSARGERRCPARHCFVQQMEERGVQTISQTSPFESVDSACTVSGLSRDNCWQRLRLQRHLNRWPSDNKRGFNFVRVLGFYSENTCEHPIVLYVYLYMYVAPKATIYICIYIQ
jgi:hypothetical protein